MRKEIEIGAGIGVNGNAQKTHTLRNNQPIISRCVSVPRWQRWQTAS
jgi:hypothetical protein